MSGPKSSRYSMTLRQRQMLQEQLRRAREAQILEERKKRNRCHSPQLSTIKGIGIEA